MSVPTERERLYIQDYRIDPDAEKKYLRLPHGGEIATEATEAECILWRELETRYDAGKQAGHDAAQQNMETFRQQLITAMKLPTDRTWFGTGIITAAECLVEKLERAHDAAIERAAKAAKQYLRSHEDLQATGERVAAAIRALSSQAEE